MKHADQKRYATAEEEMEKALDKKECEPMDTGEGVNFAIFCLKNRIAFFEIKKDLIKVNGGTVPYGLIEPRIKSLKKAVEILEGGIKL